MSKRQVNEQQFDLFTTEEIFDIKKATVQLREYISDIYANLRQKQLERSERACESLRRERQGNRRISARGNPAVQWTLFKTLFHPTYKEDRTCEPVYYFRSELDEVWV